MNVYGISDLHLSFGVNKPMDIFGSKWKNYEEKVKENWNSVALDDDVIIIPGDISWGMTFKEIVKDFEFINNLKGNKIILKGNHDYYFSTKTKVNNFLKEETYDHRTGERACMALKKRVYGSDRRLPHGRKEDGAGHCAEGLQRGR